MADPSRYCVCAPDLRLALFFPPGKAGGGDACNGASRVGMGSVLAAARVGAPGLPGWVAVVGASRVGDVECPGGPGEGTRVTWLGGGGWRFAGWGCAFPFEKGGW